MTLVKFLEYASGPGVNAVVGFVLAFLLEFVPGFEKVAPRVKRLGTMLLSFVVPIAASLGLYGLAMTTEQVWLALVAGFVAFFASQGGHAVVLPGSYAAKVSLMKAQLAWNELCWLRERKPAVVVGSGRGGGAA